jgi:hypothetical protein
VPDVIGAAIVAIGAEVGITITAATATAIAQAGMTLAAFGYSANKRRQAARAARNAFNASLRDRNLTVRGTLEERDLVMGRVRKGGFFYPIGSTGADSEKFTFIVVMAGHSCQGVVTNYFDEHPLTLDGSGWVTSAPFVSTKKASATASLSITAGSGSVTLPYTPLSGSVSVLVDLGGEAGTSSITPSVSGALVSVSDYGAYTGTANVEYQYNSDTQHARVRWVMGSDSQAAFADLITDFPALWTSAHRLRGCTYAVIELTYSQDIFPNGVPNFSAVLDGANTVYDPRTTTTGFSDNPALLARWYALHPLGGRRTTAQLDEASFIAAANVCDGSVDYGDGATALYQAGYVAKAGQTPAEVLDELTEAMAGRWGYTQGRVRVRAGAVGTTVAAITSDWLLTRQMSTRARRPRSELRNVLQGVFTDAANNYQALQFSRVVDSAAVTSDGGELVGELEFPAIARNGQAQQVAACMLRYERQALIVTLTLKMRAFPLQLFDVVSITLADMEWTAKLFEVVDRSFSLGGGVQLSFKEIDASIFTFGSSFPINDPAPNSELPDPRVVPTVGTLTVTSAVAVQPDGTVATQTTVAWPAITDAGVTEGGYVEVAWTDGRLGGYNVVRADSAEQHQFIGLQSGVHYIFKARAVNGVGVRGDWSSTSLHQIARKTTAPATVAGLAATAQPGGVRVSWTASTAVDHGETEVRYGASWAAGTVIYKGRAASVIWPWPTAGSYTVRAKHRDTSGNESASDSTASITVGSASLINTSEMVANAVTDGAGFLSSVNGGVYGLSTGGGLIVGSDGIRYVPPVDCVVEVVCTFEAVSSGAGWETLRNAAPFAARWADTSGGVSFTVDANNRRGDTQPIASVRAAYVVKHRFTVVSGTDYLFGLSHQSNPSGTTITYWNLRTTISVFKK